ncbi:pilus assembly protein [Janthinobacterium sp. GW460P]|uniref:TadE/TadG family type IV pilus assembly protein n=1 Tax=unclassified Janthinobacterium TaxID=2610881 RepID=UPI000A32AB84|nr:MULTISPECIES: TadE/TadG family type IV pilus assembly protein [unclassified Janthinobacterium]MCC7704932.1 pilus assembly protein [Janthinobacterium sp. GW460P]MCC7710453.1 pilus assembly protein [Janthinobacterium sp. GW460W]
MRPPCRAPRRQEGVAAIELALILLFFMALLPFVLLFGRALLVYTALQKSTHDAARYLATMPLSQMARGDTANQGAVFARQMVVDAMAESWPAMQPYLISVECVYADDSYSCGTYAAAPLQVRIKLSVDMPVDFLPELTRKWLPQLAPIPLRANATLRYVN